jgi:hypothetical protein
MILGKAVFSAAILLLMGSFIILSPGCSKELENKTYSNHDFSFEYPGKYSVAERGLYDYVANDISGVVEAFREDDEIEMFQTIWIYTSPGTIRSTGDLRIFLEDAFAGIESIDNIAGFETSELAKTTKAGQELLYQYYTFDFVGGDRVKGIVGAFYCEGGQKMFRLSTMNSTISKRQDVLEDFQRYLDSFVCHQPPTA